MSADWYPGIRSFCTHWGHAPMLQQTFEALEREFNENSDACIDAAKAVVECACRVIVDNLDNPISPVKPVEENPAFGASRLLFEIDREAYKVVLNACLEARAAVPQDAEVA